MVIKLEFCVTRLRIPLGAHLNCPMSVFSLSELFMDLLEDPYGGQSFPANAAGPLQG